VDVVSARRWRIVALGRNTRFKGVNDENFNLTSKYHCRGMSGRHRCLDSAVASRARIKVALTGAQQVPPVQTGANGMADLSYDPATRMLTWSVTYDGLSGPATMAHFHGPAVEGNNGPPVIWLAEKGATVTSPIKGQATLTPEQAQQLTAGEWYVNVHTQANPNGEIRGQVMPPKS
jgi:CHRD domain